MTKVINMTQNCVNEVKYCSRSVFDEGHTLQHGLKPKIVDFHMSPLKLFLFIFSEFLFIEETTSDKRLD